MILGISTNTRLLGLAIIHKNDLIDYSIHLFKSSWSPSKANEIITRLEPCVRQYCIKSVVLSIPHEYHQTEAFKQLLSCIQKHFEMLGIPVYAKSPELLHSLYPSTDRKTKKILMKYLAQKFPQLSRCYQKEMRNKNKYYIKLFEAVAAAILQGEEN